MAYVWNLALETANTIIDRQHKELFAAINNLLDACAGGKGRAALDGTIAFLSDYTAKHFADEEKLQLQHQYPDYSNHKRYHMGFRKVVQDLGARLREEGPTVVLVGEVNRKIGGWLTEHIKTEDKKVAAHIRACQE